MKTFKKITKAAARKLYNAGKEIYLHTNKLSWNNAWQNPMPINYNNDNPIYNKVEFQTLVNEYSYYNCDNERGNVVIYLIEVK